jgi:thiamine kinase-like enzyme
MADKISSLLVQCNLEEDGEIVVKHEQVMGFSGATIYDFTAGSKALFLKHVVFNADDPKLDRNTASYIAEIAFLSSGAKATSAVDSGLNFPSLVGSYVSPDRLEFVIVTESLSPTHCPTIPATTTHEALLLDLISNLGRFHGATQGLESEIEGLWQHGSHIVHTYDKIPQLAAGLSTFCENFKSADPVFQQALDMNLATRLQEGAPAVTERVKTRRLHLVHGDVKLANFLFATDYKTAADCVFLDFQWTGMGCGATDLVYFFATCLPDELIPKVGELKERYFAAYTSAGAVKDYTREAFEEDYSMAILDYARWVWSYRFPESKPQTPEMYQKRADTADFNVGNYQKSVKLIGWLVGEVARVFNGSGSGGGSSI